MVSNTDTTKAMVITTYQRYNHLKFKELHILLGDDLIQNVKVKIMLGVKIAPNLSWRTHINKSILYCQYYPYQVQTGQNSAANIWNDTICKIIYFSSLWLLLLCVWQCKSGKPFLKMDSEDEICSLLFHMSVQEA